MPAPKEIFQTDAFYHIYNKAVGDDLLFQCPENYLYFLSLIKKQLNQFVNFYAYCLMPNHFHFLIQIKEDKYFSVEHGFISEKSIANISNFISRKFGNVFNAYAQAYNKQNNRNGSLFKNRFQRKRIQEEKYLKELVQYIHLNPLEAGLCEKAKDWHYSSFEAIVSVKDTILKKDEIMAWFGGLDNFEFMHRS